MFRLACICAILALASAQGQRTPKAARYVDDPKVAAILSEQRYLSGDGTFGAAYTQEDGVDFKEESDAAGNRRGSYSYLDPSGQRRTISYTAGKNGFVATGDHLPVAPSGPAAAQPQSAPRYSAAPQQQYAPQQQQQQQQQYSAPQQQYSGSARTNPNEDDGQYYPELYEREDSQSRQQYVAPQPQYQPAPQPQYQAAPQPQYQPTQQQFSGVQQQARYVAPKVATYQPQYNPAPVQQQFSGVQTTRVAAPAPKPQQYFAPEEQTQAPHRFFPPGKLDLNRSPDGYSYSFSSTV